MRFWVQMEDFGWPGGVKNASPASSSLDSRLLPLGLVFLSLGWYIIGVIWQTFRAHRSRTGTDAVISTQGIGIKARFNAHVSSYGGYTIFSYMVVRLIGTSTLLYLSTITPVQECGSIPGWKKVTKQQFCLEYCLSLTFLYSSLLAVIALVSRSWSGSVTRHNIIILLSSLGVYTYRDIWPLATHTLEPADKDGTILWVKIAVLGVTATIIPLFIPNTYVPVDPKNPMHNPTKELTGSWISKLTFAYIDSVILLANKVSHLGYDHLPPLLDVDRADYLTKTAFPYLDSFSGAKRRHLFVGLIYHFRREYGVIGICLVVSSFFPVQLTLSIIFLSNVLGWSALVGLFSTIALSPLAGYIANKVQNMQRIKMKKTDARVQGITEAIGVIRMIKLFGWVNKMSEKIREQREEELRWIWSLKVIKLYNMAVSIFIPRLSMLLTYGTYTVIMKKDLNASKIFSSMIVFSIMRDQLARITWQVTSVLEAKVSLDRLSRFLTDTEVLDRFVEKPDESVGLILPADEDDEGENVNIGFRNASFSWSVEDGDGTLTPSSRNFRLRIDGELLFRRHCINMIVGPTGCGKTSVLMALLGEMHFIRTQADSWFNLPRGSGVAYAAQESWVQSATIRDNILFGSAYDEERYKKVIHQCALEHDLELFDAGDNTEVGERGLTLSGGQKARVTLARAVYSNAEIILLDDVLAALDVHTSAWIVDKCFRGDLVKERTLLIVTHNIALVGPTADFVISLGLDGSVLTQGTEVATVLENDPRLASNIEAEQKVLEDSKAKIQAPPKSTSDGKLVVAEEIVEGHITWRSMQLLFSALGGRHPIVFFVTWFGGMLLAAFMSTLQPWFLGVWGSQYETRDPSDVRLSFYLTIFVLIVLCQTIVTIALNYYFNYHTVIASRTIHQKLVESVFEGTFRWLDETPTSRIIARSTQDISVVDTQVQTTLFWVFDQAIGMATKLGAIVLFTPVFIFPGLIVAAAGGFMGSVYLKAQLSIKREMSNARSPLLAHFNGAIHGLVSIRAYGAQQAFKVDSFKRIDHYTRIARTSWNLNRWVGVRMDFLGAIFTASLAFYQVYGQKVSAGNTGFSLNMAVNFCGSIFWLIRVFNLLEVESNSLERIQGYLDIDHEPKTTESGKPPAAWPTSGELRVENLSARYSQSGPEILHNLTFHVSSGQRIGIVGRTGSGKSSLTLALLRSIVTEGAVYYDGALTSNLNLDALRSSITIIPQMPELLSGTLRQNLDPFDQNDDATLNDALRASGLFSLQQEAGEARVTLESKISAGGSNLSVGQRQIIALARAMVRGNKLLILDEATSAIDYKTDAVIQTTLRSQLPADVTVITVAHRLQTIMDADKIMVLDNGKIAEFDSPSILLKNEKGALRALVDGSGDKQKLYALAEGK